ncbi:MAG: adenylate kinase [Beutenbergiaceae bacterium]
MTQSVSRLLLIGPPGSGKGTQAVRIAEHLGIPAISTGDIFRMNVAEGTDLGKTAQRYMDAGEYVPDEVTNAMVADRLTHSDAAQGFLLDGYPRTQAQVKELDQMLERQGVQLDAVVELAAHTEELVTRLLGRAAQQGRSDDTEPVIRRRLEVYTEQTAPLVQLYDDRGLLLRVDGLGSIDEVGQRLQAALSS